jgi:hypothetical protein
VCIGVLGWVCRRRIRDGLDGFGLEMDVSAGGMLLVLGFLSDCHYTCGGGRWCGDCWIWVLEVVVCSDDVMVVMRWCCGEEVLKS